MTHTPAAPNGDVYFRAAKKVLGSGLGQAPVEIRDVHLPGGRGTGGVHSSRGGAQQAPAERARKAAGQTRELPGEPAQVNNEVICNRGELLLSVEVE